MPDKPDLTLINTTALTQLPAESQQDYKTWVLNEGLSPSAALRRLMEKYNCPKPDASLVIKLIELTYPGIDVARENFTFKVNDSAYPNSDPAQFSDADFDAAVAQLRSLKPGW